MPASQSLDPGAKLRRLLSRRGATAVPGVFNPAVALLAEEAGFECLYLSGAAFANSMGLPDLGVTTLTEVAEAASRISAAVPWLPLIVDVDTGFGETVNISRTVKEMERAGASAIQIEDQVMPKRCGHLDGKEVIEPVEMAKKIIAAKAAAKTGLVIMARTDAAATEGIDAAMERAKLYQKAGADVIFPEALGSREGFVEFGRKVKGPLLANMTEFGKTPFFTASEFEAMGYRMVIWPVSALRVANRAQEVLYAAIARDGGTHKMVDQMQTRAELYATIGLHDYEALDASIVQTIVPEGMPQR